MTEHAPIKTFPSIQGRCPACRGDSLFIGSGGYVTCSRLDCPNPSAADDLLHGEHHAEAALARARSLHRETCALARGELHPPAFTCGMCDALDIPPTAQATEATDSRERQ